MVSAACGQASGTPWALSFTTRRSVACLLSGCRETPATAPAAWGGRAGIHPVCRNSPAPPNWPPTRHWRRMVRQRAHQRRHWMSYSGAARWRPDQPRRRRRVRAKEREATGAWGFSIMIGPDISERAADYAVAGVGASITPCGSGPPRPRIPASPPARYPDLPPRPRYRNEQGRTPKFRPWRRLFPDAARRGERK